MNAKSILHKLQADQVLSPEENKVLTNRYEQKLFSIHWELKIILYLGVTLLSTGVGFLIYLNIDTIGHTAIVSAIGLACAACFYYAYKHIQPFSWLEVRSPHPMADYILLLGCLLFVSFEGYLQAQYNVFGTRYGIATLIPAVLFFLIAYRFDHKGILSMAICGIAGWLGLTVTPLEFWDQDFGSNRLIFSGILLGAVLTGVSYFIISKDWKKHFSFTYYNFGMQLLFVCTLSAVFAFENTRAVYFILLAGICWMALRYARKEQSFYFLLMAAIYGYVGVTYLFILFLIQVNDSGIFLLCFPYFIISCVGIIYFFFNYKKFLKP
ncbi:MAG TPA: DUF2157 domain-containing protein [Cytophagaceae bacterium]|nr:DUF2157 domain-containing protein [Cytophagaceae bacterium]